MGRAKDAMELEGRTFLARVREAAEEVFEEVIAVARAPLRDDAGPAIYDQPHGDSAPIFGVGRALRDALEHGEDRIWVLAVDYPLVTSDLLRFLRHLFESADVQLAVPVVAEKTHMLCAGYSTSVLNLLEQMMASGHYKLRGLLDSCTVRVVSEEEIAARFDPVGLTNVNTPVEYERLRRRYAQADTRR